MRGIKQDSGFANAQNPSAEIRKKNTSHNFRQADHASFATHDACQRRSTQFNRNSLF